jgi:hypothetical protein
VHATVGHYAQREPRKPTEQIFYDLFDIRVDAGITEVTVHVYAGQLQSRESVEDPLAIF